jgi:hypothetical protein
MPASFRTTALLLLFALLPGGCASWWQVRPYADFVLVEIQPGDRIRITTKDGEQRKAVVASVRSDRIVTRDHSYDLADIALLEKRSESPPANPCRPALPLGCSVPDWAALLHDSQSRYRDYFYPSCEQHDFCYRHGWATYGHGKEACDSRFLSDMQAQCHPGDFTQLLQIGSDYPTCGAVAMEFYLAVQKYGAARYRSANSSYCEYDGPP